ncbi:gamma-tubulin complex component 6-like [Antedon mediterranea]|uniref:gamma-tubulin complex component 6-like n=1 Tax=Antedon mediterranea TaxID=105859 RepID=UPI003AF7E1BA
MDSLTSSLDHLGKVLLNYPLHSPRLIQPNITIDKCKRRLRVCAYNSLFHRQPGPHNAYKSDKKKTGLCVFEELLVEVFKLRERRSYANANRLEQLVIAISDQNYDFNTEIKAVMQLLLLLSGTEEKKPKPPIGHKLFQLPISTLGKKNKVLLPNGPLFHQDSPYSHDIEHHGYPHYSRELFECTSSVGSNLNQQMNMTKQVFHLEPGKNIHGHNLFDIKIKGSSTEEFERRTTLYHALIHSRTADLNVKLSLPELPENTSQMGLKIPVNKEVDDEGFNESMSSDVTTSTSEDVEPINIWEAALTHKLHKNYSWETIGSFPKPNNRHYLSEAGPEAFDQLYLLRNYALTLIEPSVQMKDLIEVKQTDLVKNALNVLLGIPSITFKFKRETESFHVNPNIHYKGTSPEMLSQSLQPLAEAGTHYWQLSQFAKQRTPDSMYTGGLTLQAFCSGIQAFLHFFRSRVLTVPWDSSSTVSMIYHAFRQFIAQLKYLWMFCMCHKRKFGRPGDPGDPLPTGIQLLSYIYQEALDCCKSQNYKVMLSLLRTSCGPYLLFVQDWIFNGICHDGYGEFMITANDDFLQYRDKYYWTHGFVMNTDNSSTSVPMFLQELANGMYVCGKTLNLLKLCNPGHFLCNNHVPVPLLSLTYSLEDLQHIDRETQVYVERMYNIVRQNTVSKEEKEARLEKAREDLLIQARKTVVDELNRLKDKMKQVKEATDEKKRKELKGLKQQMQKDLVRRAIEVEEEKETDRLAVEKQDRIEKGIADVEDELEKKAREELIQYYAKLTEEAIHREQHALWKIQRHKLKEQRSSFLQKDAENLKEELIKLHQKMSNPQEQTTLGSSTSDSLLPQSSAEDVSTNESDVQTVVEILPSEVDEANTGDEKSAAESALVLQTNETDETIDSTPVASGVSVEQKEYKPKSSVVSDELFDKEPGQMNLLDTSIHDFLPKPLETVFHPQNDDLEDVLIEIGSELPSGKTFDLLDTETSDPVRHPSESHFTIGKEVGASSDALTPTSNTTGQGIQSTIEDILYSMRGISDLPQKGSYGHASDVTLTVNPEPGEEIKLCEHRSHHHGHSSDSTMGGLIHGDADKPIKHKQRSKWGHPSSTSEIIMGILESAYKDEEAEESKQVKEVKTPDVKGISEHIHGHSSDSSIQTLLYSQEPVKPNEQDGKVSVTMPLPERGIHGHSSDSSIQKVLYGSGDAEKKELKTAGHVYRGRGLNVVGHPSDSKAGKVMYGDKQVRGNADGNTSKDAEEEVAGFVIPDAKTYMPFEDDFSRTCSLPSVDLLKNAGILPMEFGNYGNRHGTLESNEAANLMSLPVILKQSIITPLTAQIVLVNKCILDYYIVDLNIDKYFESLRSFLFLQDGEFSQSLCDQLFEKLAQGLRPSEFFTPILLNQILSKAIQHSLNRESNHADDLSFSVKSLPHIFKPNAINSLDCLELKFKIDWPRNIVITRNCLDKYNHVFSFMLQLKRASWVLRDIYFQLKRSALLNHAGNSTQFRQLQLFRHEMQHFVNVIQGYIANQVVNVSWEEFKRNLKTNVQNLDDLHNRHAEYLNKALFRCLLNKKAAPVMKIITDIFCLILKVRTQLVSSRWFYDPDIHQVVHPAFQTIRSSYSAFKEYSGFLYKVVSKLVTRGYQPHLEEFLLRLNFNDFYSDC